MFLLTFDFRISALGVMRSELDLVVSRYYRSFTLDYDEKDVIELSMAVHGHLGHFLGHSCQSGEHGMR